MMGSVLLLIGSMAAFADPTLTPQCNEELALGDQLLQSKPPDYEGAARAYNLVLQQCPDFDRGDIVHQNLAFAYLHLQPAQIEQAVRVLEEGVQRYPTSAHLTEMETSLGTAYVTVAGRVRQSQADDPLPIYRKAVLLLQKVQPLLKDPGTRQQVELELGKALIE